MAYDPYNTNAQGSGGMPPPPPPPPPPPASYDAAYANSAYPQHPANPTPPPPAYTHVPMPPPPTSPAYTAPSHGKLAGNGSEFDSALCGYMFFGAVCGLFFGLFGLLFMLCECTGIQGARKSRFVIGWAIGLVLDLIFWIVIIVIAVNASRNCVTDGYQTVCY